MVSRRSSNTPRARSFQSIWTVVARVPRGRVVTYGQVARMAGMSSAARTVGWAMQALPDDHRIGGRSIPWHRVINAQGKVSPRGEIGKGGEIRRQTALLRREGIRFSAAGVIDLDRYLWMGRPVRQAGRGRNGASAPGDPDGPLARIAIRQARSRGGASARTAV